MKTKREQMLAAIKAAQDIAMAAQRASRGLTTAEKAEVEGHLAKADQLEAEIKAAAEDAAIMKALGEMTRQAGSKSILPGSRDAQALQTLAKAVASKSQAAVSFQSKEALTHTSIIGAQLPGGTDPVPYEVPAGGLGLTQLRELLVQTKVDQPSITYYTVSGVTGVDVVAEGQLKPEILRQVTGKNLMLSKLAGHFKTSTEMKSDAMEIVLAVLRQAMIDLTRRENQLVLDAFNTAEGIAVASTTNATVLDTLADVVGTHYSRNGFAPDFLIGSPTDLANLRKLRTSGSGEYLVDPFSDPTAGPMGLKVAAVPGMTPGTMYVANKAAGKFWFHRDGVQVNNGYANDDLLRNLVTSVVEERVAAAVTMPSLVTKVTIGA